MKKIRKVLAAVLAAVMLVSALPLAASAASMWESAQQLDNLALTATAEADNYLGSLGSLLFGASYMNDGDLTTVWRAGNTGNDGDDAVLTLHWDEPQTIACMAVVWVAYSPDTHENGGYKIQVTDADGNWIDVGIINATRTDLAGYIEDLDPEQTEGVDMSMFSNVCLDVNLFGAQTTTDMRMVCMKMAKEVTARDDEGNPTEYGDVLEYPMANEVYCYDNDIWTIAINYLLGRDEFEVSPEGELTNYYGIGRAVTIPDTVTSIKTSVFYNNNNHEKVTSVTIPATVTEISPSVFFGCSNLTEFIVAEDNPAYCAVDGVLYNKDKTRLIAYPAGKADASYTVLDTAVEIGENAFYGAANLTEVVLSQGLELIGDYAFAGSGLTTVDIPASVTTLGMGAFANSALTEVTVPATVGRLRAGTFAGCLSLESVILEEGVTEIGSEAFGGDVALTSVELPLSLTTIANNAFLGCLTLNAADYPGSDEAWDNVDIGIANTTLTALRGGELGEINYSALATATADSVSTNGGGTMVPELTIDGDTSTRWQSNRKGKDGDDAWLALAWNEAHTFTRLTIEWEISRSSLSGYVIQSSEDGETWTNVPMSNSRADLADNHFLDTILLDAPVTTRYLRVYVTGMEGIKDFPSIYEFCCYGEGLVAEEPTDLNAGASEGLEFTVGGYQDSYYTVTGIGTCTDTAIVVPSRYNGKPVVAVEAGAFAGLETVTSITLSDGILYLYGTAEGGAIQDCPALETISLPASLILLEDASIRNCPAATILYDGSLDSFGSILVGEMATEENPNPVLQIPLNHEILPYSRLEAGIEVPPVEILPGDVDLSGEVGAADLTLLARHVGGVEAIVDAEALLAADINGDEEVGAADLTKLARHVGGIETIA